MQTRSMLRTSLEGAVGGALAGAAMNAVTTSFLSRQSHDSRARERKLSPDGAPNAAARRLLMHAGFEPDDETVRRVGRALHWTFPVVGGIAIGNLTRGKRRPLPDSMAAALVMWALFDEITPWATGTTPSPAEYPLVTHARGLVGHVGFGAVLGNVLTLLRSTSVPSETSAVVRRRVDVPPERVFDVLLDPTAYVEWVVGARSLRAIDDDWPAPGSAFHHELARASGDVEDKTVLVSIDRPRSVVLKAYARPLGIADVSIHVAPDDGGCVVAIEEKLARESGRSGLNPLCRPLLHIRNVESLRRLERTVAERPFGPRPPV